MRRWSPMYRGCPTAARHGARACRPPTSHARPWPTRPAGPGPWRRARGHGRQSTGPPRPPAPARSSPIRGWRQRSAPPDPRCGSAHCGLRAAATPRGAARPHRPARTAASRKPSYGREKSLRVPSRGWLPQGARDSIPPPHCWRQPEGAPICARANEEGGIVVAHDQGSPLTRREF